MLSDKDLTRSKVFEALAIFSEKALNYEHMELGYSKPIYKVIKAYLNAYTRLILPKRLKNNQACFACHPGWCKTRLGGNNAPLSVEEGTVSLMKVIEFSVEESLMNNGTYFNENGEVDYF